MRGGEKIFLFASLLGLLSACAKLNAPTPTPLPLDYLPTIVALTGQAAFAAATASANANKPTALPTETLLPTETPIPLTAFPSATPTIAPGFTRFAELRFVSPGPMSSLVSPIDFKAILTAGKSNLVRIDLLGEDGRILYSNMNRITRARGGSYRSYQIAFEIRAVSENGYIRISSKDDRKRLQSLNTMPTLLYSVGETRLNLPGNMIYERVALNGLKDGAEIIGGTLNLKGLFWPFNKQPVFIDLIDPDGKVIASRVLNFKGIEPETFETTLPYKITKPTLARLAIHQENPALSVADPDLKKYIYYYSIEILLKPQ